jgi:hypothetical protein
VPLEGAVEDTVLCVQAEEADAQTPHRLWRGDAGGEKPGGDREALGGQLAVPDVHAACVLAVEPPKEGDAVGDFARRELAVPELDGEGRLTGPHEPCGEP